MPYDTPLTALVSRVDTMRCFSFFCAAGLVGFGSECVRLERERERIFVGVLKRWVCGNLGFNGRVVGTGDLGLLILFAFTADVVFCCVL